MPENEVIYYVSSKWVSKEDIGSVLDEDGPLENRHEEKAEAFSACFASVFNKLWALHSSELEEHSYRNSDLPFVDTGIVRGQLQQLNVLKSTEPWWDSSWSTKRRERRREEQKRKEHSSSARDLEQSSSATAGL